ncbi:polyadenylate-specific 3'-exoribonuclease AS [Rhodococcus sp. D2-41]|uniref:3'-5' exoribonuclease n=1 Tax=Speluncibacter jeojiensis TaxID=2710754 RepID=A0A9X4M1I1_9ACTN|nr:polyadenylate-specific 3'-exoribonuclease AS [Rhodococcus sp. D2-41]MDG3011961.1 polyadenylate-specific 3'-exoribonuclease AS [Rhodococcus sp. D2-41]MDG3013413.1 polyadenylate-specific 3'-exoribonuclease AS [Corynebacteriales bacterium D3-21]
MRYFYDCEFIEDGRTIDLVSLGMVAEDGREFYAVSTEFDPARAGKWVRTNVLTKLPPPSSQLWRSRARIRDDLVDFLGAGAAGNGRGPSVELWAWIGAYDHVALCQLFGDMPALPQFIPRFTRELKQYWEDHGRPALPGAPDDAHDALADARHNLERFRAIEEDRARRSR